MSVEYFTWEDFDNAVEYLAKELRNQPFHSIYGPPRGGLPLAVSLSHKLDLTLVTHLEDVVSRTLVVDDICDSGLTMRRFVGKCCIATIHMVEGCSPQPDYYYKVREAEWVIYPWEVKR